MDENLDPMKTSAAERLHALRVVLWSLTIINGYTSDERVHRAVHRAEVALRSLDGRLTSETWPPADG